MDGRLDHGVVWSAPAGCFDVLRYWIETCRAPYCPYREFLRRRRPPRMQQGIAEHTTTCPLGVLDLARRARGTVCRGA